MPLSPRARRWIDRGWAVLFALIGVGLFADAARTYVTNDCASFKVASAQFAAIGDGLARICRSWGPLVPCLGEALAALAMGALARWRWREAGRSELERVSR